MGRLLCVHLLLCSSIFRDKIQSWDISGSAARCAVRWAHWAIPPPKMYTIFVAPTLSLSEDLKWKWNMWHHLEWRVISISLIHSYYVALGASSSSSENVGIFLFVYIRFPSNILLCGLVYFIKIGCTTVVVMAVHLFHFTLLLTFTARAHHHHFHLQASSWV